MSWYSRAKSFVAKTSAKAADVEGEFDNVAEAFNEIVSGGRVGSTSDMTLTSTSYTDVPGATVSLSLGRDSLVKVDVVFAIGGAGTYVQTYWLELASGSHVLKLRAKKGSFIASPFGTLSVDGSDQTIAAALPSEVTDPLTTGNTGFTYLVFPG